MDSSKTLDVRKYEPANSRSVPKQALPLPVPPRWDKFQTGNKQDEKKDSAPHTTRSTDETLLALKAYRRARGLCERCAEKWKCGHRCAPTVALHAVEEL